MQTWKWRFWYGSVDSEDIWWLRKVAEKRDDLYAKHTICFPNDVRPAEALQAAVTLRELFSYLPLDVSGSRLNDIVSYPTYLFTQLAKEFPDVHHSSLDRTVQKLVECHNRCAPYCSSCPG